MRSPGFLFGARERRLLGKEDSSVSPDPGLCPDSAAGGERELTKLSGTQVLIWKMRLVLLERALWL